MNENCYLKPASTHNGSVRTDLPLVVIEKKKKRLTEPIGVGQLLCVGKIYVKTHNGMVRIR